ncbi:MAG: SGNH/GDSL hydrolase family protein [Clostridia bacterium]|nr:SGNH/GDSL hydrolase family protein [Clostridia bacterium]
MDVSKIDKNFALPGAIDRDDVVWMDASQAPIAIYGAVQTDPYMRMPIEVAKNVSERVEKLASNTAGIRAVFSTDSSYIAIRVEWEEQAHMSHMPILGMSGFDLYSISEKKRKQKFVKAFVPSFFSERGYESMVWVESKMTEYVLNFPLYNGVSKLWIGVREGSSFGEVKGYLNDLPVVFYGSSITQGACCSRPGNCYQNFLSRAFDIDYVNLGFSGGCMAEDSMIDYLAGLSMSAFVSDYDHNAPDVEHLRGTHEKLYRRIREKHPDIPYIMVSRPNYNYGNQDSQRRNVITDTYRKAIVEGDGNVYFLDGASIFSGDESDACTVDGAHPNDLGFYRFYKALEPIFEKILY